MEKPPCNDPNIILSRGTDVIRVTAQAAHFEIADNEPCILGELSEHDTGSISARVMFEQVGKQYRCYGDITFPASVVSDGSAIFGQFMTSLSAAGLVEIPGQTAVKSSSYSSVYNVATLNMDRNFIDVIARCYHNDDLTSGIPMLDATQHSISDTILGVGRMVSDFANVAQNMYGPVRHTEMSIMLPGNTPMIGKELVPHAAQHLAALPEHAGFPTFDQFGGLDEAIEQLKEVAECIKSPGLLEKYGLTAPAGILLQGDPGVGKTELVRALANEMRAEYQELHVSDIMSMWIGKSEENLRKLFDTASESEGHTILFFDEFDGLFSGNAGGNIGAARALVAEFKTLLSNMSHYPNVLIVAAANSLDGFDPALLRPGRFDTVIKIGKPNNVALSQIFHKGLYAQSPHFDVLSESHIPLEGINMSALAEHAYEFTGADIQKVLQDLLRQKMRQERGSDIEPPRINEAQIICAIQKHRQNKPNDI